MQSRREHVLLISVLALGVIGAGSWLFSGGSGDGASAARNDGPAERRERVDVADATKATRPPPERTRVAPYPAKRRPPRPDEQRGSERRDRGREEKAKPKKTLPNMG